LFNLVTTLATVIETIITLTFDLTIEGFTLLLFSFVAENFIYIADSDLIPEIGKR
jgi:hypothetical protein